MDHRVDRSPKPSRSMRQHLGFNFYDVFVVIFCVLFAVICFTPCGMF